MYLSSTGAITINSVSENVVCEGTTYDPCYVYINFTANEDIFIYPVEYDPWGRNTPFIFDPAVKEFKLYRSWGSGWREYSLYKPCTSTWCGAPPNSPDNKYSLAWRKDRNYTIRIEIFKHNSTDKIKVMLP